MKAKSAEILCVFRAFLTHSGANKCLFRAIYHYGALPKDGFLFGGPEEIRTPDPHNANVMRSQLRYRPMKL